MNKEEIKQEIRDILKSNIYSDWDYETKREYVEGYADAANSIMRLIEPLINLEEDDE